MALISSFEKTSALALVQEDAFQGDELKVMRLRAYKEESNAWPPVQQDSKTMEQKRQARLFRDKFNPDFFHLRPSLPGGPEAIQNRQ
mmetsp:Transcript_21608/g.40687  ORF Transcript_21608/g.40687 Transcript_21608/m.40687 type:complete len:87 (-) Transcript_21608:59-319(-)